MQVGIDDHDVAPPRSRSTSHTRIIYSNKNLSVDDALFLWLCDVRSGQQRELGGGFYKHRDGAGDVGRTRIVDESNIRNGQRRDALAVRPDDRRREVINEIVRTHV